MLTRRSALLIPCLLAVSACQPRMLDVRISGTAHAIQISARRASGLFGLFSSPAPMAKVSVTVWISGPQETVWEIASAHPCQPNVFRLQYGIVPAGFEQSVPPQRLSAGVVYSVWVEGCVFSSPGPGYFEIIGGRVRRLSWQDVS